MTPGKKPRIGRSPTDPWSLRAEEELFCSVLLRTGNATRAAEAVGLKWPDRVGNRWKNQPRIQRRMEELHSIQAAEGTKKVTQVVEDNHTWVARMLDKFRRRTEEMLFYEPLNPKTFLSSAPACKTYNA